MARSAAREHKRIRRAAGLALLGMAVIAVPLPYLLRFDHEHALTAVILALASCGISLLSPRAGIIAVSVFLAALGDYRRYAGFFEGYPLSDSLLLVGPVVALFLFARALLEGRLSARSWLAKTVGALMLLMLLQVFNPVQGGLQIGAAGVLFYLVPLSWFWIGQAYGSLELMSFFSRRVVVGIGILAAVWGLFQARFGLFGFEQRWVDAIGYGALYISDDVVRSIGFFNASAEYQRYLAAAAAALLAMGLAERSWLAACLPLVLVALFLAAARGPVLAFTLAAIVLWSICSRTSALWLPRLLLGTAVGAGALVSVLLYLHTFSFGARVSPLVQHQIEGLLDPANARTSTAAGHLTMIVDGLAEGVISPAGHGLGSTTIAADKYGARKTNSEFDVSNIMISLGLLGGLLYGTAIVLIFRTAIRWWKSTRTVLALVTVGLLTATFGGWLIGGEYSMAALLWMHIGAMDALSAKPRPGRARRPAHP